MKGLGWVQTLVAGWLGTILLGGTVYLLAQGRTIPDVLWQLDTATVVGLVAHGAFLALNDQGRRASAALEAMHTVSVQHILGVADREHELAMRVLGKTPQAESTSNHDAGP